MSQNLLARGATVPSARGAPAAPPTPAPAPLGNIGSFSQRPERSGVPSAVLGAVAFRFGLPSGVVGTPAVGHDGHWAESGAEASATRIARPAARNSRFMSILPGNPGGL